MKLENYVCYKDKYNKIQSLGVEIDSLLLNDERSFNQNNEMVGGSKNKDSKLFRANLGIPLPLLLIQEEANNLRQMLYNPSNTFPKKKSKKKSQPITCVSNNLFDHLMNK